MAGATNRALKSAGLPKSTIATVRAESGGRLNLQSAIAVARSKGLDVGKAHEHLAKREAKAASKATATPTIQAAASRKGGAAPGRISDLRRVPILRNAALDVRATPTVLKEYFAPNLSGASVGRRQRMAALSNALTKAVTGAPAGSTTVRFQVGALGEGGVRGSGQHQRLDFKARLLKGKGDGGKDMVAINVVGGSNARRAAEARAKTLRSEASLPGRGVVREGGALRLKSRGDASVPFRHRGETVYAVRSDGGSLARVVRSDGGIVRNSEATKRGARVVRAVVARQKAGPSPAMKRGEAARAKAAAASTETSRRAALVAASSARRNRTNPTAITNDSGKLYGAEASFSHRGQQYRVRHTAALGTDIRTASGSSVSKPKKALRQRAARVIKAVAARVKSGGKGVESRVRAADEY